MLRVIAFLIAIGLAAAGAAWIVEQTGTVTLVWGNAHIETSLPVFAFVVAGAVVAAMVVWSLVRGVWRLPQRVKHVRHRHRADKGRKAIAHGLIAIGTGDANAARKQAQLARRFAEHDPLTLLLSAQAAQLAGDGAAARHTFTAMAARPDTRILGLRGLFIEAQRRDDAAGAAAIAEEAFKTEPRAGWAAHAVLGFRCARRDWQGALAILDANHAAGQIDKAAHHRQRAVLLTAQARDIEKTDRDRAQALVTEAVKLAPTLTPAAVLASKFLSEGQQIRKAMRVLESAWREHPHPDVADAYAHVRLGDSARERLARIEALAAKAAGHVEGALAVARAAIDASEFGKARAALAGLLAAPTQRVALLMADIERGEHGEGGRAREWTTRAVRAAPDPAWTADGYVSSIWHPVSPVTGRLDAFQWTVPVAALPSERGLVVDAQAMPEAPPLPAPAANQPPAFSEGGRGETVTPMELPFAATVVSPPLPASTPSAPPVAAPSVSPTTDTLAAPALFRTRTTSGGDAPTPAAAPIIAMVRAPDDPGVDDDADNSKEFVEPEITATAQPAGWRGALGRWLR